VLLAEKACEKATAEHWKETFAPVIDDFVKKLRPIVPAKPVVVRGGLPEKPWIATYGYGGTTSDTLYLPFKPRRKVKDTKLIWHWVHALEKMRPPKSLGMPHPSVPWPDYLYVWVGPDGHPIRKKQEKDLLKWRRDLQGCQSQKTTSARSQEIGPLRSDLKFFPIVVVDPDLESGGAHYNNLLIK
jgi:hypothetical protein